METVEKFHKLQVSLPQLVRQKHDRIGVLLVTLDRYTQPGLSNCEKVVADPVIHSLFVGQ
jgi:hypothetical protein